MTPPSSSDLRIGVVLDAVVAHALGVLERSLPQRVAAGRRRGARGTERCQRRSCRGEGHNNWSIGHLFI